VSERAFDLRLRALDNVVLLPHMGSATIEGRIAMGEKGDYQHQNLRRRPPPPTASSAQCYRAEGTLSTEV
jgi:lactate dehydrogenase-like 2-hydroxyacid dehydrogenase